MSSLNKILTEIVFKILTFSYLLQYMSGETR